MCQLTLVHLNDKILNQQFIINQSFINSLTTNQDGFGYFSGGKLRKTEICPSLMINLGDFTSGITKETTIAHVRLASINNRSKLVNDDNAHPFETKDIILMHNGSLDCEIDKPEYKDLIDSDIFTRELQLTYDSEPDFVKALQQTYNEKFDGKFAFLIFNKREKKFYVARGETAELNYIEFWTTDDEYLGFALNTDKQTLSKGYLLFNNYLQTHRNKILNFSKKNLAELDKNTIFVLNKDGKLEKVGELKETKKAVAATVVRSWEDSYSRTWGGKNTSTIDVAEKDVNNVVDALISIMKEFKFTLKYLDILFQVSMGVPLLGASKNVMEQFIEEVIPIMRNGMPHKNIIEEWGKIVALMPNMNIISFHKENDVQFPYLFDSIGNLRKIRRGLEDAKKNTVH